jgi:hypothetical protein
MTTGLDNSQLIQLAVNELYKKHNAQRAFGDVINMPAEMERLLQKQDLSRGRRATPR